MSHSLQLRLLDQFGVNKGMLREVSSRLNLLKTQLQRTPERVEEIDKEINFLENEMDVIFLSGQFLHHALNEKAQV